MSKFKVGDKIIAKKDNGYSITTNGWIGTVTAAHGTNINARGRGAFGDNSLFCFLDEACFDKFVNENEIVITTDGKTTRAIMYSGKEKTREAIAKCSADDEFDFTTGAKIAFERLTGGPERDLRDMLKNGVFGKSKEHGCFVVVNDCLILEKGGYCYINDYDKELKARVAGKVIDEIIEIYSNAVSFRNATIAHCKWKRGHGD